MLKEIDLETLADVMRKHSAWVRGSRQTEGRADLSGYDLSGDTLKKAWELVDKEQDLFLPDANFSNSDVSGSDLSNGKFNKSNFRAAILSGARCAKADFGSADLSEANLQGCNLEGARFHNAILDNTNLRDAVLRDSDLGGVKGLRPVQLAGADLTLAELPDGIKKFESLSVAKEIIDSARTLHFTMLLTCVYCWLTLATTTDAMLLTNSSTSNLPLIGTSVPIIGFFYAAPAILVSIYLYFHLLLQRLWERLARSPAIFPDGEALNEKISAWPFTGILVSYFPLLLDRKPEYHRVQYMIVLLLGWMIVPATIDWFAFRSLTKWDVRLSHYLYLFAIGVTALGLSFLFRCVMTFLRIEKRVGMRSAIRVEVLAQYDQKVKWSDVPGLPGIRWGSLHLGHLGVGLIMIVPILMLTMENMGRDVSILSGLETYQTRTYVVNVQEEDVSFKPQGWKSNQDDLSGVRGAKLRGQRLEYARAAGAFLACADLRDSDLRHGDFIRADFREALMESANLGGSDLSSADLRLANLKGADLTGAKLVRANLSGAELFGAQFEGVDLSGATLKNTTLVGVLSLNRADFESADLRGANLLYADSLTREQLVRTWVDSTTIFPFRFKTLLDSMLTSLPGGGTLPQ